MSQLIINALAVLILLVLIRESMTIHMGSVCAYSNAPYISVLITYILIIMIAVNKGLIEINTYGILIGLVIYLILSVILNSLNKNIQAKSDRLYSENRQIDSTKINYDKLDELIKLNNILGIKHTERKCSCQCPFNSKECLGNDCSMRDMQDILDKDAFFEQGECLALLECTGCKCEVFNVTVDPVTYDSRDKQKGLCLLAMQDNDVIKGLESKITNNK